MSRENHIYEPDWSGRTDQLCSVNKPVIKKDALAHFFQPLDSVSNGLDTFHILALGLQFRQSGLLRLKVRFLGLIG